MFHSDAVPEVDAVLLTRAAAIGVVRAVGEERREDAVLHVKHRHVVVDRQLEPIRRRLAEKGEDLIGIEIVREGESLEAVVFKN